ncbi:glycosyltransferase family 9 protein [Psychroflexus sediminis]|uniref:Heptosyltransferase-2 n=1 Tax=Psychroflexus sediminis TaxID=470826 RepID=A0A1G7WWP0_9FLAO|nr:glycosyltransferase family 9 protein [Psychroflexus sediminis]SDG76352.1 heptosyltransferase-2 [Psychroflexus sediminis]
MEKKKIKVNSKKATPREGPDIYREGRNKPSFGGAIEEFKILVIQQKMIGDVLVSSLICENLKLNYPEAEIHYLVNRFTLPVIENNPYIDEVIIFEDVYRSNKLEFYKFLKQIRKAKYDVVIDAYGKLESNLISVFSGAKTKIGWNKPISNFICTSTVNISDYPEFGLGSAIENRLNLVKAFNHSKLYSNQPKIHLTAHELNNAKERIRAIQTKESQPVVMISALGSNETKTYPLTFMAEVLDFITLHSKALLILNFMPAQIKSIEKLFLLCEERTRQKILLDFEIGGLREFMSIAKFCKAIIGNEGGATNMGKALDIPTFSIFSPRIKKEGWNGFENTTLKHVSVHLKDFNAKHFENQTSKKANEIYEEFTPDLFFDSLKVFLAKHVN